MLAFQCFSRCTHHFCRWRGDVQKYFGPTGQHSGHERVWCALSCPSLHRSQDPRGKAGFCFYRVFQIGRFGIWVLFFCLFFTVKFSTSHLQAHWYNVRYRGSNYPPEIVRREDLVERPVSEFCHKPFIISESTSIIHQVYFGLKKKNLKWKLFYLSPGSRCFGLWHWDHQTSTKVPWRRDGPDYDDLLHDWWTGQFYSLHTL